MNNNKKLKLLRNGVKSLITKNKKRLSFHGWHHIYFVEKKSKLFAKSVNADKFLVSSAALTHDLNYIVEHNSAPEKGRKLRSQLLRKFGYEKKEIQRIEEIVIEAHTAYRRENISKEGMALSDADTLFKVLPTTAILFTGRYLKQNKVDLYKHAEKITKEQNPLLKKGIFFYTKLAEKKYLKWAKLNLALWNFVLDSLEDEDVRRMIRQAT